MCQLTIASDEFGMIKGTLVGTPEDSLETIKVQLPLERFERLLLKVQRYNMRHEGIWIVNLEVETIR